ncbi:MAG: PEGA domain-containing protein [Undibacterium sp.]|nr:PEGA domain-containing protein [Undibacterium sp.]
MEYVIVTYPTSRIVNIDGENGGKTNQVLRVDAGKHQFDLGSMANYTPTFRKINVKDTTVLSPLEIIFNKKGA